MVVHKRISTLEVMAIVDRQFEAGMTDPAVVFLKNFVQSLHTQEGQRRSSGAALPPLATKVDVSPLAGRQDRKLRDIPEIELVREFVKLSYPVTLPVSCSPPDFCHYRRTKWS